MKITEFDLFKMSQLKYRTSRCEFGGKWNPQALILEFTGRYGIGSEGNGDADFIAVIRNACLAVINSKAVVFDFRNMEYEWGNRLFDILRCPRPNSEADDFLPTAMVISDKCRQGFATCVPLVPPMFETLEEALAFVERPARKYVDELMADVE